MVPKIVIDPEEKKRLANEKRLKAVKQWKKNKTVQNLKPVNSHKIFDTNDTSSTRNGENKPQLFDCEDEEDKYEECFRVRPQFEGPHGQELLEMSSQFSERFKLDERFQEDVPVLKESSQNDEKEKNIKILQSVLGYEVTSKSPDKSLSRKRHIRFDPEDESASKYVKISETQPVDKSMKQKKCKKLTVGNNAESSIPISTERYIEVSSNLKEILSAPSTPFSLSQSFNQEKDLEMAEPYRLSYKSYSDVDEVNVQNTNGNEMKIKEKNKYVKEMNDPRKSQSLQFSPRYFTPKVKIESFFIKESDPRLKEGIEFFKRPKSMEEIRADWERRREYILEGFRRKQRTSDRSYTAKAKVQAMQRSNLMRKQNFKK